MGPKKAAATVALETAPLVESPAESSGSDSPEKENSTETSDAAAPRKVPTHPPTVIMVKEALKVLDSRKGVSYVAIQNYIKQKYPSVDSIRVNGLVRKALKKGIEAGTFIRSVSVTGTTGRFRLEPKLKQKMAKGENEDPNVQKAPKSKSKDGDKDGGKDGDANGGKDGDKKRPKADAKKPKSSAKSQEDSKSPKKSKKTEEAAAGKVAPVKKPKAKKAAEDDDKGATDATNTKATKTTKEAKTEKVPKETKPKKVPKSKAAEAPAAKATGKRGKKAAE